MTKLLVEGEWFEQIAPSALYEAEYERVILQQAPLLYPDYYMVPFKASVYSDSSVAKPDAVLVEKTYREWWVVEIELAHHSLGSHVLPQVQTLADGYYQEEHAEHISKQLDALELKLVADVIKGKPPRVLVIANAPVPDWEQPLRRYNALVAVFEIFRSDKNRHIFRVNGARPVAPAEVISECYFDHLLPNFLVVDSPATLGIHHNETVKIQYRDWITEWTRVDSQGRVWLVPVKANPLQVTDRYELLRQRDGILLIRPKESRRKGWDTL